MTTTTTCRAECDARNLECRSPLKDHLREEKRRPSLLASTTTTTTASRASSSSSAVATSRTASAVTCSSGERASRLCVPGRSTSSRSVAPSCQRPVVSSTVVPGALTMRWRASVSVLNSVDFPTFGNPTRQTQNAR